tara:strand:+ start:363 stop:623 length:261 start_codon:yes stop_codon:yes gene_type:complete
MNNKPRLVDYSLFEVKKPKLKIKPKKPIMVNNDNNSNSIWVNVIGLLILCIGGICLYQRLRDREEKELEKQNMIIGFHQYVKENIK